MTHFRAVAALLVASGALYGQTFTATLAGVVTDPNGAMVPNATVAAVSAETGLKKTATSDAAGRYTLPFLAPGLHTVTAEAAGFAVTELRNVRLEVAQTATLDLALRLQTAQQTVSVTAETVSVLSSESPGLDYTLENKLIEDLPSGNRGAMSLITAIPGVVDQGIGMAVGLNTNGNAQNAPIGSPGNRNFFDSGFSAGGGQASTSDILLDGVSDTLGDFNGLAVSPPQDSVQEFKVLSGHYSAEYGRSGAAIVNFVTKAGGKDFHGTLYEYFQNGDLNANGWQRNRAGSTAGGVAVLPRIPVKRNQFGGAVGGPVMLPKVGRLKNTFFFFNYEGRRERNPFSQTLTLPTSKMRTGDLSELLLSSARASTIPRNADGSAPLFGQIYDPFGPLVRNPDGVMVRNTIPGNRLDRLPKCGTGPRTAACLDPVGLNLLTYLPLPNQPSLTDNYLYSGVAQFRRDLYAGRIDKTLSDRHSLFGRFSYEDRLQANPDYLNSPATGATRISDRYLNVTFNDVFMLGPAWINNFRWGYTRAHPRTRAIGFGFNPTTLGLPSYISAAAAALSFPIFSFSGGAQGAGIAGEITGGIIGGNGNNQPRDTTTIANTVTLIRGAHNIKTGIEYRLLRFFAYQYNNPDGTYAFNRTFTRGPVPTSSPAQAAETGSSLASLMLGLPASATMQIMTPCTLYHHYGATFVQDTWKLTRRLTLDIGLRWDVETGTAETHGQATNFDFNAKSPLNGVVGAPADPTVLALRPRFTDLRGLLGFPSGPQTSTNFNRFAPRIGLSFRLNDKTTIRGGYGLTYVPLSVENGSANGIIYTTTAPQSAEATGQVTQPGGAAAPTLFLTDPFPGGLSKPPGTSQGAYTLMGQSPTLVEPERPTAYIQQWNLIVQRLLPGSWVANLGYNGSHGVRLPFPQINVNQIAPEIQDWARANYASARDASGAAAGNSTVFFNQQVTNPFFGIVTNPLSALATRTVARSQLLKPYPQYDNPTLFRPLLAFSKYHALQAGLQKRFGNGMSMLANYTWSKFIDLGAPGNASGNPGNSSVANIYNLASDYSLSDSDIPHRFTSSFSYELPFGRGKRFGKAWRGPVYRVLGDFQVSGTVTWQSGTPINIVSPCAGLNTTAVCRSDRAPGVAVGYAGDAMRENIRQGGFAFNPAPFTTPAPFAYGTATRTYDDARRDSYKNVNLSVLKNFRFGDGTRKLQLRGEFLNVFNMIVFGTPGTSTGSKDVVVNGVVTQAGTFARVTTQANQPRIVQLVMRFSF
jgi:hypothetical protein